MFILGFTNMLEVWYSVSEIRFPKIEPHWWLLLVLILCPSRMSVWIVEHRFHRLFDLLLFIHTVYSLAQKRSLLDLNHSGVVLGHFKFYFLKNLCFLLLMYLQRVGLWHRYYLWLHLYLGYLDYSHFEGLPFSLSLYLYPLLWEISLKIFLKFKKVSIRFLFSFGVLYMRFNFSIYVLKIYHLTIWDDKKVFHIILFFLYFIQPLYYSLFYNH